MSQNNTNSRDSTESHTQNGDGTLILVIADDISAKEYIKMLKELHVFRVR